MTTAGGGAERDERFRALWVAHAQAVLAFAARRCSGAADAEEVLAETFLVAWRRLDDLPEAHALPWLYGVARRVVANQARGRRRRRGLAERLAGLAALPGPEASVPATASGDPVLAALARLPARDREVLRLVAWENLGNREIAAVLGCSVNAAAIRVHRARTRLSAELAKEHPQSGHDLSERAPRTEAGGESHR